MIKIQVLKIIFLAMFFMVRLASAEFRCESKVSYTVELTGSSAVVAATPSSKATVKPEATQLPESKAETKEQTIPLALVVAKGEDEAKAKAALIKSSMRQIEQARSECRERHENVAGCIATKFQTKASTMRGFDFSARKALEKAISADCEVQRGICKKAEASEPVCSEIIVAAVASVAPEAAAGKDDKKKKK